MQEVNGFAALLSGSLNLEGAIDVMGHRGWRGLAVRRKGSLSLGLCLIDEGAQDAALIHGDLYYGNNNDEESKQAIRDLEVGLPMDRLPNLLERSDGSYAFVRPLDDETLVFGRDPLGTKPLYYAGGGGSFGIASDPRILQRWFGAAREAEPGVLYRASQNSLTQASFNPLQYNGIGRGGNGDRGEGRMEEAIQAVSNFLHESVRRRVAGKRKVVLGFSGGIDSLLLAALASRETDLTAVTVCTKDSADYRTCQGIADRLGIPLRIIVVEEDEVVRDTISRLSTITHLRGDAMHASIACVVYLLAKFARESGADALMLGQLADELFGGYARYLKYLGTSAERVSRAIFNDVTNAHRLNFWRDEAASSPFTRLLLPYASLDLVRYALNNLGIHLKLDADSGRRKIILRELAKRIGIDEELAEREKKAMQFSSGIYKIVSRLQS